MNGKALYEQVGDVLLDFEKLEPIQPSDEWRIKLLFRINNLKPIPTSVMNRFNVLVLLLFIINFVFVLRIMHPDNKNSSNQYQSFETISRTIFINPISTNQ